MGAGYSGGKMDANNSDLGHYFDALYQITLRVSSSLDLPNVLAYLTEETAKAMGVKAAGVRLLDAEGARLEMAAVYGLSSEYLAKGPVELRYSRIDREILSGQPQTVQDVTTDRSFQYPEQAAREGICSIASVPLIAQGQPIGVLRVYSKQRRVFTDTEIKFLTAVADLAALAIVNARLFDQVRSQYEDTMKTLWGETED